MKILVIAVGKISNKSPEYEMVFKYLKRIPWKIQIKELDDVGDLKKLSEKILKSIPVGYVPVLLDKDGKNYSSEEFSNYFNKLSISSFGKVAFLIGAAGGFHKDIYNAAQHSISFGKMTYAHKLARIILLEQLYRAWTISVGHPYHR